MPYIDDFQTLRERAGLRKSRVAREAQVNDGTIDRIESHKNSTRTTLVAAVNALNALYYNNHGGPLDPDDLITVASKFGGISDTDDQNKTQGGSNHVR